MTKAISEVLETMFFLTIDFEDRAVNDHVGLCEASIPVWVESGELTLVLRVAEDFARMAAANFLGVDDDKVDESEVLDVVREMANMVGGGFIENAGENGARLGIPTFRRSEGEISDSGEGFPFSFMGDFAGVVSWKMNPSVPV
jgi:CheY-specific phosphatase CheX